MVAMSCDDMNKFLFDCGVIASPIHKFFYFCCDCFSLEINFIDCFITLHNHRGEYMVVMSCDDMNKFLYVCVDFASRIHKFNICNVNASCYKWFLWKNFVS